MFACGARTERAATPPPAPAVEAAAPPDGPAPEPEADEAVSDEPLECTVYDPKNYACRNACVEGGPPDLCPRHCPDPPDVNLAVCQLRMACPNPPDKRVRACYRPQCVGPGCLDLDEIAARVLTAKADGDSLLISIGAGSDRGVAASWKGSVLDGNSDRPLATLAIIRVDKNVTVARVRLTEEQVRANNRVRLRRF